jgi:hypothetical protein
VIEVLEPLFSKVKYTTRGHRQFSGFGGDCLRENTGSSNAKLPTRGGRSNSDSEMVFGASGRADGPTLPNSSSSSSLQQLGQQQQQQQQQLPPAQSRTSFSFLSSHASSDNNYNSRTSISGNNNNNNMNSGNYNGYNSSNSNTNNNGSANNANSGGNSSAHKSFSIASLFSSRSRASTKLPLTPNTTQSQQQNMPPQPPPTQSPRLFSSSLTAEQRDLLRRANPSASTPSGIANATGTDNDTGSRSAETKAADEKEDMCDPIFNLMDNYAALVCCAFLHVDLLSSLFVLGVDGKSEVAQKSRELIVKFVQILANVLPEPVCADLLTNPSLVEVAATLEVRANRAHNASQLLCDIAHAFTLLPSSQETLGTHVVSTTTTTAMSNNNTISTRNRNMSITNKAQANNGSNREWFAGFAGQHRSNFLPLKIETVYELAQEIKISSSLSLSGPRTSDTQSLDALQNLRLALTPVTDKHDFVRQMDCSRVIGKEGKGMFLFNI